MNLIKSFIILVVLLLANSIFAKKIQVDTKSSLVTWKGSKVFFSSHDGVVSLKEGSYVEVEKDKITGGEFILDMTTIENKDLTGKKKKYLEDHLKNDDFFAVKKYPTATFKIKSAKKKQNYYDIKGSLTMRGKTKNINFKAKIDLKELTALSTIIIDRQKWGVAYKGKKDNLIKDEIEINFNIKGKK